MVEKLVTDKVGLEALLRGLEKVGREMQQTWYTSLTGDTPYNKLQHLVTESYRVIKINERLKRWWDKELSEQVRKVAAARRGGKGKSIRENNTMSWKKWKGEKVKRKWMIREKMRNCWQRFLKEHGIKDPWEVVRLAKNPRGSKSRMNTLKGLDGKVIEEEDRAEALENAHFLWQDRKAEVEYEDRREDAPGLGREKLKDRVLDALSRTSNTSAPGPDSIRYKIIK